VRQIDGDQIGAVSTGGAIVGLRVAIGAGLLALGWLVLGSVSGDASAAELDIGDGSLLGPDSSLAVVTEPVHELTEPVHELTEPVLESVEPVLEPVLTSVEPVLDVLEPVLQTVEPVLQPALDVLEPVLQSVEPVLETVGVEATVFDMQPEGIQAAQEQTLAATCAVGCNIGAVEQPTYVPVDIRSVDNRSVAAIALGDPARHAPVPSAPFAPMIASETVTPGASGGIALASDIAERGWASSAPSVHTRPPGDDIPPASPTYDSDSTPD
jgi:hypothetical protein